MKSTYFRTRHPVDRSRFSANKGEKEQHLHPMFHFIP